MRDKFNKIGIGAIGNFAHEWAWIKYEKINFNLQFLLGSTNKTEIFEGK
jgi:hypothetical protein